MGARAAAALLAVMSSWAAVSIPAPPSRSMALTFDDLPYVSGSGGAQNSLAAAERATAALLRVMAAHRAPVVGFVNEAQLGAGPELEARTALLQQWIDAGAVLGNHTHSHPDFNTMTIEQFQEEILKGEVVTRRLMRPRQPYQLYFRHPMTHTGDTQAKKEAIEAFLAARGYKVAPHTIEAADYMFNAAYVRARGRDEALAIRLRESYVDFLLRATEFAERVAPQIFGRQIPQTLLLHANDLNADVLDEILKRLEARGYAFVTLDVAMADAAYQTPDTLVSRSGPTWLWRWMKSRGQTVSFKDDPEPPEWVAERFNAALAER